MRRMKWFALPLAGLLLPACATSPLAELAAELRRFDDNPVQVAVMVVDLDSGDMLLAREAQRLFRPASTMKLLTTSAICQRDPDGEFVTEVRVDAVPAGRVTLIGGGDPLLSTAELHALAKQLHEQGVREVNGPIRVVDPLLHGNRFGIGWMWDDEPATFQPAISAAIVDAGCVTVEAAGNGETLDASLLGVPGELELHVEASDARLSITRGRYRDPNVITVSGRTREGRQERRTITVPDPARHTGHVLADALRHAGITIADSGVEVVATNPDPNAPAANARLNRPMADVVIHTNKVSDNLGAELLLRRLATLREADRIPLGPGSESSGLTTLEGDVDQNLDEPVDYRLADGSGVSHYNLVSASLLWSRLSLMHRSDVEASSLFRRSLPIAGVDGTLRNRMKGTAAEGRVFAKTGTVSGVSNLAGYVETESGRNLAFVILCQNFVGSSRPWRELQDRICATLAAM